MERAKYTNPGRMGPFLNGTTGLVGISVHQPDPPKDDLTTGVGSVIIVAVQGRLAQLVRAPR